MKKLRFTNWRKHGFEFLSIFVAVVSAFALNNWNENRKAAESENKILTEIANGLVKDEVDINENVMGHQVGLEACDFFLNAISGNVKSISSDSLMMYYLSLTRDNISMQNMAGYETLKSRGLELVKNDSLRLKIISLYEYDYTILRKMEEEYQEMQFQNSYYDKISESLAPNFELNDELTITGIQLPIVMEGDRLKEFVLLIAKIRMNRSFILHYYENMKQKIREMSKEIEHELKE